MQRVGFFGIGAVIGVALVLGAWFLVEENYTYQGVLIDPPAPAADFELTDQDGNLFRLREQRGKIVLIFFGYTHCPDVCPITLSEFVEIKRLLGDKAKQVSFVFITTDPQRDTQERLKKYIEPFDQDFIGLTGDVKQLEAVWRSYGVFVDKVEVGSAGGYLVDHTARTYTIDQNGNWRLNYPFGMETGKLVQDLIHLLSEF